MAALEAPWPGAVAVSGGGDSLALMHLLASWAKRAGKAPPTVLTVDHRLQANSAAHARDVLSWARRAGLRAHALRWKGALPVRDIEAAAREARYRLMGAWCRKHGIAALYVGHTRDDQAETFLLRLARGSGLDGLSAMSPVAPFPLSGFEEIRVIRPLMAFERGRLRLHLTAIGQEWIEDPMNADPRFERVKVRQAIQTLGIAPSRVAAAAAHLGRAREALDAVTEAVLRRACRQYGKGYLVEASALASAPREVGLRALSRLLMIVSGAAYRPRFERLERLFDRIARDQIGAGCTLHGCKIAAAPVSQAYFGSDTLLIWPENSLQPVDISS